MKDADQITNLLEAAKAVLEEDIIPSLPNRKRLNAQLVGKALSIALNTTYQMVRKGRNEPDKNNEALSNQIRSGIYDESLTGRLLRFYLRTSTNDWRQQPLISNCIKNSLNI